MTRAAGSAPVPLVRVAWAFSVTAAAVRFALTAIVSASTVSVAAPRFSAVVKVTESVPPLPRITSEPVGSVKVCDSITPVVVATVIVAPLWLTTIASSVAEPSTTTSVAVPLTMIESTTAAAGGPRALAVSYLPVAVTTSATAGAAVTVDGSELITSPSPLATAVSGATGASARAGSVPSGPVSAPNTAGATWPSASVAVAFAEPMVVAAASSASAPRALNDRSTTGAGALTATSVKVAVAAASVALLSASSASLTGGGATG